MKMFVEVVCKFSVFPISIFFARFAGYSCCIEINISGNVCKSIVHVRLFSSCDLGGVLDERANFAPKFVHLKVLS